MKASGNFKVIENKFFGAVALPTEKGGSFIIALPKEKISLSMVEAAIIKSGRTLETFVETVSNSTPQENIHVLIPRLSIQIIHEWSTPSTKVMGLKCQ